LTKVLVNEISEPLTATCIQFRPARWIELCKRAKERFGIFRGRDGLFKPLGSILSLLFIALPLIELPLLLGRYRTSKHVRGLRRSKGPHGSD
jgi:hypothetical protein